MSVACIMMIDAKVSGVIYTVDPNDSRNFVIMISSVWGLAIGAVEGSTTTDFYRINKENRKIESTEIVTKKHYGYALDIEWAIDQNDKLFILQARPLKRSQKFSSVVTAAKTEKKQDLSIADHPILLKGGASASEGTAAGLAYIIESDHTFHHIPEGAIVIVQQTSPRYVPLMSRVRAIVTDVGSIAAMSFNLNFFRVIFLKS